MIGIILGSGLGHFDECVENPKVTFYKDIPNFPTCSVNGHKGKLVTGTISGKEVAIMSGRFHAYEGYKPEDLQKPIDCLREIGCTKIIATNASGAINPKYKPGDVVVIKDHIKLSGIPALYGPVFFDVSDMYTSSLRKVALEVGKKSELTFHEGIYFYSVGPNFETPAEIRAMGILGGDVVGMSTVFEAITAARYKIPFLCLSVVSNMAAGISKQELTVDDINNTTDAISKKIENYMKELVKVL